MKVFRIIKNYIVARKQGFNRKMSWWLATVYCEHKKEYVEFELSQESDLYEGYDGKSRVTYNTDNGGWI